MEQIIPPGSRIASSGTVSSLEMFDKTLIDLIPEAAFICNSKGDILYYNDQATALWGFKPSQKEEDVRLFTYFREWRINDKLVDPGETSLAEALKTGRNVENSQARVKTRSGIELHLSFSIKLLKDEKNKVAGAVCLMKDISELKSVQEALKNAEARIKELGLRLENNAGNNTRNMLNSRSELKESEERYHKMVEEVEDYAIIFLDENGIVQNWNKGAEKIKGYAEPDIVGKSFELFYLPEDRAAGLPKKIITQAFTKGKAVHEGWRLRKDGTMFWGSIVLTALHNRKGKVIGFSKVTRDLTMQKIAEDKLKKYTQQLEFQNKELEQFAYAASHDMKEPLRKIQLYNYYIAENEANILDSKSREYLNRSIKSVKKMGDLIDDLLSYSKASIVEEDFEKTDLNEIVNEILLQHKEEVENSGMKVDRKPLPVINGIPFQLKQLFDNLLSNAIKYKHPQRNLELDIGCDITKGAEIGEPGIDNNKFFYRIYVRDNGIGFNQQFAEKVFEIFQRLSNTMGISGSGIGLAISKRIVQNHKGKIRVTSIEGEGSEFEIFLPKYL